MVLAFEGGSEEEAMTCENELRSKVEACDLTKDEFIAET